MGKQLRRGSDGYGGVIMAGWTPQPALKTAAFGLCPRCGARGMFQYFVSFAPACPCCHLDYQTFDVGDAAAPFLIFIVGAIVIGLAIWLELSQSPPWWLHVMLWLPLTLLLTIVLLRIAKGLLLTYEFRNDARLGRLE